MRIKSIKILGKIFTVTYLHPQHDLLDCGNCGGKCHLPSTRMYIADDLNTQMHQEVVLHEMIHALSYSMSLDFDEATVMRLGEGLLCVFKSNPKLLQLLQEK